MQVIQAILENLKTPTAEEVCQILQQENSKVKKHQLFQLIKELEGSKSQQLENLRYEIQERQDIINKQQDLISRQKQSGYDQIEGQNTIISILIEGFKQALPKHLQSQNKQIEQELLNIYKLEQDFKKSQQELISVRQNQKPNNVDQVANAQDIEKQFQDQQKIVYLIENANQKSEKLIKEAKQLIEKYINNNNGNDENYNKVIRYCQQLISVLQLNQNVLKKIKENQQALIQKSLQSQGEIQNLQEIINEKNKQIDEFAKNQQEKLTQYQKYLDNIKQDLFKNIEENTKKLLTENKEFSNHLAQKWNDFQTSLKAKLYRFNQAILKGIIDEQIYLLQIDDLKKFQSNMRVEQLQILQNQQIPENLSQLQQNLTQMVNLTLLSPGKNSIKAFEKFVIDVRDQIERFYF